MSNIRQTGTKKRHDDIYKRFESLLNDYREKYPDIFHDISTKKIYDIIAEDTGYSSEFIGRVVRGKLKETNQN